VEDVGITLDVEVKKYTARRALKLLRRDFKIVAKHFAHGDWALEDDLLQEMRVAVLECNDWRKLRFYRVAGVNRAKNVLRNEGLRVMTSIESYENPDDVPQLQYRVEHAKRDSLIDALERLTRLESSKGRPRKEEL